MAQFSVRWLQTCRKQMGKVRHEMRWWWWRQQKQSKNLKIKVKKSRSELDNQWRQPMMIQSKNDGSNELAT